VTVTQSGACCGLENLVHHYSPRAAYNQSNGGTHVFVIVT